MPLRTPKFQGKNLEIAVFLKKKKLHGGTPKNISWGKVSSEI